MQTEDAFSSSWKQFLINNQNKAKQNKKATKHYHVLINPQQFIVK